MTGAPNLSPPPAPPVAHDAARESRRRLMVGLGGLVSMLLLVVLAGFITEQARKEQSGDQIEAVPSPTEPLGDVATDTTAGSDSPPLIQAPAAPVVPDSGGTITVPDLQPDPQLEAAKNRQ
jgi:hypothetical protein